MPSQKHIDYRTFIEKWFKKHGCEPDVAEQLERYKEALLILWEMDLEPARPVLERCYAPSPRGGRPWDPIVMLRCFLLALLVGQPSLNKWAKDLAASRVLRVLAGIEQDRERMRKAGRAPEEIPVRPGVGTLYGFLHRLHDGPVRKTCEHVEQPSENERRRASTPRKLKKKRKKKQKAKQSYCKGRSRRGQAGGKRDRGSATDREQTRADEELNTEAPTEKLVEELKKASELPNPTDLLQRLSEILFSVGVMESACRGLLGDVSNLVVSGDGSPLRTGANRHGKPACDCPDDKRCDCPRFYSDPDAEWGWDSHRNQWFFGHHFYEVSCSQSGHDLPLAITIGPGNRSDYIGSLETLNRLYKNLKPLGWKISVFIGDAGGHDAEPIYRYLMEHGTSPVIPLRFPAPPTHPQRPDVKLSKRGVPLCKASAEMASWGSAGAGRSMFICPVKARRLDKCPLAPENNPDWVCRPDLKWGPSVNIKHEDNPRLCPPIPRNSKQYKAYYKLRSGTERSNSVKKEKFSLEKARHRRKSFWLIRLHLIALLQHGRAWVAQEDADALVDRLLGRQHQQVAA